MRDQIIAIAECLPDGATVDDVKIAAHRIAHVVNVKHGLRIEPELVARLASDAVRFRETDYIRD